MYKKISIVLLLLVLSSNAFSEILFDVESGAAFTGSYNDIGIPGDTGTRFSAGDDLDGRATPFFRFRVTGRIGNRHNISALVSILKTKYEGKFDKNVNFQGKTFISGVNNELNYKFNNYRLTYRYDFFALDNFRFGAGLTLFIRDAYIELKSSSVSSKKSNLGVVPLINLKLEWFIISWFGIYLDADFLFSPNGRAEDFSVAFLFNITKNLSLRAGYRMLEGGADNESVYNFTIFHFITFGITVKLNI